MEGISIATLTNSGLFEKARLAEQKSKEEQEKENAILSGYENKINDYLSGTTRNDEWVSKTEYEALTKKIAELENANSYSTTEKCIGTWIDGKKLYRKTIILEADSSTVAGWISYQIDIPNVDNINVNLNKLYYFTMDEKYMGKITGYYNI